MPNLTKILRAVCIGALLALCCGPAMAASTYKPQQAPPSEAPGFSLDDLRFFYDELEAGAGRDRVPPIFRPQFVRVSDAGLSMDNREPVFVIHYPTGLTRVYPQSIMVWHEVVNDVIPNPNATSSGYGAQSRQTEDAGNSYTISYSPLTGTITAFKSRVGKYPSTFGNEGKLLNANLVLYDHTSGTLWSQLLAVGIEGPMRGRRLERYPVYWSRWGGVKQRYPDAQVMSRATGHRRSYGRDPYGSYFSPGSYYDDTRIYHPVSRMSDALPPKERILGIEMESLYGALIVQAVRNAGVLNQTLGIFKLSAFYDSELDRITVFNSKLSEDRILEFHIFEGKFMDKNTKSEWNSDGECVYGSLRGTQLQPILAIDSMWFAWYAFHPDSQILGAEALPKRRGPDIPY
ncbi:DUF3179 domain-containing protein [Desulfovibrio sp. OttesenSCG-928-C06]|nr:DUF3179 domain-containing protein [Desulfovibrio sp. OttesenSCG-928-C06]